MRADRNTGLDEFCKGWSRAFVLVCLVWLFVILPLGACVLGWALR
jgi:hypothetical protein